MPNPRIVGSATATGANVITSTGVTITKATLETAMGRSLANGDHLLALCSKADDTGTDWQSSSGGTWNLEGQMSTTVGNDMKSAALWRRVTNAAGEPSSYQFTVSGTTDTDPFQVVLMVIENADRDNFLHVAVTTNSGTNDITPTHVNITTTIDGCLIIMFHAGSMNAGSSAPTAGAPSYADGLISGGSRHEAAGSVLDSWVQSAYKNDAPAGAQSIGAWTTSPDDTTTEWHVMTLAILPDQRPRLVMAPYRV